MKTNITVIVIVAIVVLALIVFVTIKNNKDRKELNPDATDSMDETIGDQERAKESN